MPSKRDMTTLRKRVIEYRSRVVIAEVDPSEPTAIMKMPVEAGLDHFIDVRNLSKVEDLPFIPERMRDFAFRYATEYKPIRVWAETYGVSESAIYKWLSHEGVAALIALTRYERRIYHMGMILQIERKMYESINTILNMQVTPDNMSTVLSTAKFVWDILYRPEEVSGKAKGAFNVNIGFAPGSDGGGDRSQTSPYAQERNVTPKQRDALEERIEYLKHLVAETEGDEENNEPENC